MQQPLTELTFTTRQEVRAINQSINEMPMVSMELVRLRYVEINLKFIHFC